MFTKTEEMYKNYTRNLSIMKDVYYQIKSEYKGDMSVARLQYTYQDFDLVIQVGSNICIDWTDDDKNIKTMQEISERAGYMFFNNSTEGIQFWKENYKTK